MEQCQIKLYKCCACCTLNKFLRLPITHWMSDEVRQMAPGMLQEGMACGNVTSHPGENLHCCVQTFDEVWADWTNRWAPKTWSLSPGVQPHTASVRLFGSQEWTCDLPTNDQQQLSDLLTWWRSQSFTCTWLHQSPFIHYNMHYSV